MSVLKATVDNESFEMIGFVSMYVGVENHQIINSVPVKTEHAIAQQFWAKIGFEFSNTIEDGYVFMRLYL